MLDELEWPTLEACRDWSFLLLFHKIHSGAVSIEKDKYLTPAHSLKSTRASHSAQYCRYQTYSDALKNSFFPRTIPQWNITINHECPCRIEISHPRGLNFNQGRGLPSPWLNSDPEVEISLSYDGLFFSHFSRFFVGT